MRVFFMTSGNPSKLSDLHSCYVKPFVGDYDECVKSFLDISSVLKKNLPLKKYRLIELSCEDFDFSSNRIGLMTLNEFCSYYGGF